MASDLPEGEPCGGFSLLDQTFRTGEIAPVKVSDPGPDDDIGPEQFRLNQFVGRNVSGPVEDLLRRFEFSRYLFLPVHDHGDNHIGAASRAARMGTRLVIPPSANSQSPRRTGSTAPGTAQLASTA